MPQKLTGICGFQSNFAQWQSGRPWAEDESVKYWTESLKEAMIVLMLCRNIILDKMR